MDEDVDVVDIEREDSRSDSERRGCRGRTSVKTDDWLWSSLVPGTDSRLRCSIQRLMTSDNFGNQCLVVV